jgi:hypothetical protein
MKLHVTPAYGWGWVDQAGPHPDVPPQFELDATVLLAGSPPSPFRIAFGQASDPGNPLDGLWIVLTTRHVVDDGACNLEAHQQKPDLSKGFYPGGWAFSGFAHVAIK